MKKQLITVAITSMIVAGTAPGLHASEFDAAENGHKQYIGTGIGAVAGGLLAGPVGLLAGGLIGNLAGKHDAMTSKKQQPSGTDIAVNPDPSVQANPRSTAGIETDDAILVSQAGDIAPVIDDTDTNADALEHILVGEMGLDVLFLSGSTSVESIYLPRLQAIANIMQRLPDVDVHLDGYSDRRGDTDANLDLSTQRLQSVRDRLVQAGVDANRIHLNPFGEQKFMSSPGDLEAYTFDRRVVIRFEQSAQESARPIALTETNTAL